MLKHWEGKTLPLWVLCPKVDLKTMLGTSALLSRAKRMNLSVI